MLIVLFAESPYFIGNQFGFREENSTEVTLIFLTDKVRQAIDNGNLAGAWFIDLSMFVIHSGKERARPAVSTTNSNYYIASYMTKTKNAPRAPSNACIPILSLLTSCGDCHTTISCSFHRSLQRTPSAVDATRSRHVSGASPRQLENKRERRRTPRALRPTILKAQR